MCLVPVTLAFILSLLIAPLVRALRRIGFGQTLSVLAAVFDAGAVVRRHRRRHRLAIDAHGREACRNTSRTLEDKLETLNRCHREARQLASPRRPDGCSIRNRGGPSAAADARQPDAAAPTTPIPVELHEAPANPLQVIQKVLGSIWVPDRERRHRPGGAGVRSAGARSACAIGSSVLPAARTFG